MDLSELLPVVAALIVAMLGMIAFRSSSRIASKAVRLAMRILAGSLAAIPLLIATALIFFALNYTRHLPQQISPDGRLIAITTYTVNNGTGVDQAEISIRHPWNPYAHRVYAGPAEYKPNAKTPDPEAQWLDSTHLRVRFNTYASTANSPGLTPQGCATQAEGVTVVCEETRVHAAQ
ncbi:hypothetical protein [Granulicella tundricola]|uniref:Uncharacterized protein n=1 Tax=Granulicella tundricola (strain ATCC BAA-1859 / DSM 23138 / MP5ACTX9) TaxID=1198114 RepID=E8WVC6_GRATM|nr:hypothetical protein [Granulicella tundricola]ADW67301.1 hypothetical protein AciX9_0227 [Granulicella tundricola MP5ACTX9]